MTEEEALLYFDSLPVDDRLRLMQKMLSDMEYRVSRARAELEGVASPPEVPVESLSVEKQLDLPGLDLPPPGIFSERAYSRDPIMGHLETEVDGNEDDWNNFELPPENGGATHAVHRLRLMDAAAQYERLLKRYGYIKGQPDLGELGRRLRQDQADSQPTRRGSTWADWVAKDQETLDRPKAQAWQDWVVIGDDDGEY